MDDGDGFECCCACTISGILLRVQFSLSGFISSSFAFQGWGKFNPNTDSWEHMENSIKKSSQNIWRMDWPEVGGGGDKRTKCGHNEMQLARTDLVERFESRGLAESWLGVKTSTRFERMCAWDDQNYVMAAGSKPGFDNNDTDGIVDGHAYTVITCLNDVAGTTHDLIKAAYSKFLLKGR